MKDLKYSMSTSGPFIILELVIGNSVIDLPNKSKAMTKTI